MLLELPTELYRDIVLHLFGERSTLHSLSLAARNIGTEAEQLLYHTIDSDNHTTQNLFLATVVGSDKYARLVRCWRYRTHEEISDETLVLLHRGLVAMGNLREVALRIKGPCNAATQTLEKCTFQLDRFAWDFLSDEGDLMRFLSRQTKLERLGLQWRARATQEPFPTSCLQTLSSISGNLNAIQALLPSRRQITALCWIADTEEGEDDPFITVDIAQVLNRSIRSFYFGGFSARPSFSVIASCLNKVEKLELVGYFVSFASLVRFLLLIFPSQTPERRIRPNRSPFELTADYTIIAKSWEFSGGSVRGADQGCGTLILTQQNLGIRQHPNQICGLAI